MNHEETAVETTLRIPAAWGHPRELVERLPAGFRLTAEGLLLPDNTAIEFIPMPPDDQFAGIFRSSCRQPAAADELEVLDRYTVNVGLTGPGGSLAAARTMMEAGAAIVRAGGAGVFIDNSGLAHGGRNWIEMTEDGGPDALSFAFVGIVRGRQDVWTMGMHVLGLPDIVMRGADAGVDGQTIIDVVRYLCQGDKPLGDGHVLADEGGPRFQAVATSGIELPAGSPIHNPFGRLRLASIKEIAESN